MATLSIADLKAQLAEELQKILRLQRADSGASPTVVPLPLTSAANIAAEAGVRTRQNRQRVTTLLAAALQSKSIGDLYEAVYRAVLLQPGDGLLVGALQRLQSAYRLALGNRTQLSGFDRVDWLELSGIRTDLETLQAEYLTTSTIPNLHDLGTALLNRRYDSVSEAAIRSASASAIEALEEAQGAREDTTKYVEQALSLIAAEQWSGADVYLIQALASVHKETVCAARAWQTRNASARAAAAVNGSPRIVSREIVEERHGGTSPHLRALQNHVETSLALVRAVRWEKTGNFGVSKPEPEQSSPEHDLTLIEDVLNDRTDNDLLEAVLVCARSAVPKSGSPGPSGLRAAAICDASQCMLSVREYLADERFAKAESSALRFRTRFPKVEGFALLLVETRLRQDDRQFRYLLQTVEALSAQTSDDARELILRDAAQHFSAEDFYQAQLDALTSAVPETEPESQEVWMTPNTPVQPKLTSERTEVFAVVPAAASATPPIQRKSSRWLFLGLVMAAVAVCAFLLRHEIRSRISGIETFSNHEFAPLLISTSTTLGEVSLDGRRIASGVGNLFMLPALTPGYHLVFVSQSRGAALIYLTVGAHVTAHADAMNSDVILVSQAGVSVSGANGTPVYVDGNLLGYTKLGEVAWSDWREGGHRFRIGDSAASPQFSLPAERRAQIYAFVEEPRRPEDVTPQVQSETAAPFIPPSATPPSKLNPEKAPAIPESASTQQPLQTAKPSSDKLPARRDAVPDAWASLNKTDLGAVRAFLLAHPSDPHARDANALVSQLSLRSSTEADEAGWSRVVPADRASLETYLSNFPEGRHASQAREWLAPVPPVLSVPSVPVPDLSVPSALSSPKTRPVPEPSEEGDEDAILSTLHHYANAWATHSLQQISALRPGLDRRTIKDMLSATRSINMSVQPQSAPVIRGNRATVVCMQRVSQVFSDGAQKQSPDVQMTYTLVRHGASWIIADSR